MEPIRRDVWDLIQGNIRRWLADPHDMGAVFDGLAATGYSMQMYLDSLDRQSQQGGIQI